MKKGNIEKRGYVISGNSEGEMAWCKNCEQKRGVRDTSGVEGMIGREG